MTLPILQINQQDGNDFVGLVEFSKGLTFDNFPVAFFSATYPFNHSPFSEDFAVEAQQLWTIFGVLQIRF